MALAMFVTGSWRIGLDEIWSELAARLKRRRGNAYFRLVSLCSEYTDCSVAAASAVVVVASSEMLPVYLSIFSSVEVTKAISNS